MRRDDGDERFELDERPPGGGRPSPRAPLKVAETAGDTLRTLAGLLRHLPSVALVPFTAVFLVQGAILVTGGNPFLSDRPAEGVTPLLLLAVPVIMAAYVAFLVDWHRLVLFGPAAEAPAPRLRLRQRDLRYFLRAAAVVLIGLLAAMPVLVLAPGLVGSREGAVVMTLIGGLLSVTAMLAFGLILPATAVDRNYSIAASFEATKEVLPQLLGLVAVVIVPAHIIGIAVLRLIGLAFGTSGPMIPGMAIGLVVEFVEMALGATLLSIIFRKRAGVNTTA
jgi:hypothetical protein